MKEAKGDMWAMVDGTVDAVVVTTNGYRRKDGACVMGRGCALEAAARWPTLPYQLGERLGELGNHVFVFYMPGFDQAVVTYPVKPESAPDGTPGFRTPAELWLIRQSARELVDETTARRWRKVLMPRPGCGFGNLSWGDVGPRLAVLLDDRFVTVTY